MTKSGKSRRCAGEHRRHALALGIARGMTVTQAAAECGYSRQHASQLNRQRGFRRLVKRLREQLTEEIVGRLVGLGTQAADTLQRLLGEQNRLGEQIPPQVQHAAAKTVLQMMIACRDATEVDELLRKTERVISETADDNANAGA